MKTQTLAGLIMLLIASVASVQAGDNPSQATARAALAKKLFELDREPPRPPSTWDASVATNQPAAAVRAVVPVESNPNVPAGISAKTNSPPPASRPAPPAAAPTNRVPVIAIAPTNSPSPMLSIPAPLPKASVPTPARVSGQDLAASEPKPVTTRAPLPSRFNLETVNGTIYHSVVVERVETNAIVISYIPANGGTAMRRLYFDELTSDTRERYETPPR